MESQIKNNSISRKAVVTAGLCLALLSGLITVMFCSSRIESRQDAVLAEHKAATEAWLKDSLTAIELWEKESDAQRGRISDAETYRMFAADVFGLDKRVSGTLNESESGIYEFEDIAAVLSDEVPAIRRLMHDFMNFNGLMDARLINANGQTILSAMSTPTPLTEAQRAAAIKAMKSRSTVFLPVQSHPGGLVQDVFEPVLDIEDPDQPVASFMVSRLVLASISQVLAQPKQEDLSVAGIVQKIGDSWELVQVPRPVALKPDLNAQLGEKGVMPFSLRPAIVGRGQMYSASVEVPGLGWSIVLETPAEVIDRQLFHAALPVYIMGVLGWAAFMLLVALFWWIGVGRQQGAIAEEMRQLHQMVSRQKELLDRVNTSLDESLLMADVKGQIHMINRAFAELLHRDEKELQDQTLFTCFPMDVASDVMERIRQTAIINKTTGGEITMEIDGEPRLFRITLFPFLDSSEESLRDSMRGAVVMFKDITEFRRRSERMRLQQESLIEAFTRAEESVDPYLAGHSRHMASLGRLLAKSLGMDEDGCNTVIMGARLSQLGKLFIPRELLTKQGRLTPEELAEVRKAPEHAYKLFENIDFDLPIPRALYEMYENMDGTGYPRGIAGDEILLEARVLNVLNAFCAMVSARSYREGLSPEKALEQMEGRPTFDPQVVEHLRKVLDTPEGILAVHQ